MRDAAGKWAWPAGVALAAVAVRLVFFTGLQGEDDILYAGASRQMAEGRLLPDAGVLGMRLGLVAPMALLFATIGVHAFSLVAVNLASSLALVALAWRFGRELYSAAEARVAALFVALLPLDVFHATEVHADLPQAALGTYAIYLAWTALRGEPGRKAVLRCLAAGLLLGWAYLAKESAFLLLVALLPWVRDRKAWGRLGAFVAAFGAVVVLEMVLYGAARGDVLHRVHAAREIQASGGETGFGGRAVSVVALLLSPAGIGFPYTGGFFLLAAAGVAWALARDREASGRVALWGAGVFLLLAFWPVSLAPYRPAMALRPRVLAAIEVPAALLAARFLVRGVHAWKPRLAWAGGLSFAALALLCNVRLHQDGIRLRLGVEWAHGELVRQPGAVVLTDGRTAQMLKFLSAYKPVYEPRAYSADPPSPGALLLDDAHRVAVDEAWGNPPPPPWFRSPPPPREVVAETTVAAPWRLRGPKGPPSRVVLCRIMTGSQSP